MKLELELSPAPKRGQYDRALSRRDRQAAQRERVIAALLAVSAAQRELNVANVVELAGIGRNTFYEYFDDIEHALSSIKARALRDFDTRVNAVLLVARTPLERIRALSRAWTEHLFDNVALARFALSAQPEAREPTQLSALAQQLARTLEAQLDARSALPGLADPLRVLAVAALFDVVSRAHTTSKPLASDELQRTLAELSLRVLR